MIFICTKDSFDSVALLMVPEWKFLLKGQVKINGTKYVPGAFLSYF